MNVNVTCNAVTLDPYLISYTREDNICNSTSILTLTLSINCPITFDFYDELIVTEDGVKKGTYALLANSKNIPQGTITINASNTQKNLENHFIEEKYDMMDTPTLKTRYWIEKFMTEAGVDYTITASGDGEFIPSDMVLGGVMALDAVKQLLQYSGWYMRYDENGTAIVGTLDYDSTSYQVVVDDEDIIDFKIEENDAMLRNRVVVWGMGSSLLENNGWTFVDLSTTTPWNYDDNDKRTILLSNSLISDMTLANTIAKKTLDEFTKPNIVKTIKVKGFVDVMVGDRVYVNSKYYSKICTATTVYVGLEQNGTTTTLTLDERCPRLIGYFNYGGYVYVGTDGDGVWRKPLKYSDTWEDYSTGLGDLYIKDLSIAGGVMACVTTSGYLYVRYPIDTQWNRVSSFSLHDDIDNVTYATLSGTIVACSVDRNTGVVYAGIRCSVSGGAEYRSWVGKVSSPTNIITTSVTVSGDNNYYLNDLDSNNYAVYLNAYSFVSTSGGEGDVAGQGWKSFSSIEPNNTWSWRNAGYNGFGEITSGGNLKLTNVYTNPYTPEPANYLDYETTYPINVYDYGVSVGFPAFNHLHAEWIASDLGFRLTANSTFRITTERFRGSASNHCLFFEFYYSTNPQPNPADFYVNFNNGANFPTETGEFITETAVGYPRYTDTVGTHVFEFAFDPSLAGKIIKAFTWSGDITSNSGPDDPISAEISEILFTNVELEYGYTNQGTTYEKEVSIPYLIEHKDTEFKVIGGVMSEGVDSSQDIPVAVYGGNETYNSGYLEVYAPPNRFDYVNLIYTTPSGIGSTGYVYDIKSFGQLVPGSGYLRRSVFTRNTPIDGLTYLQLIDYDLASIPGYIGYTIDGGWESFEGTAKFLEVSNNGDNPYFFVSIGGSPSGFYQKDAYDNSEIATTFRDCSYGLPTSEIRCIRLDDLV